MTSAENADLRRRIAELVAAGDTGAVVELVSQLAGQRDQLAGQRDQLAGERDQLAEQVDRQAKNIAWMTRLLFGRKSEKLSAEELGQLVLAYGASEAEAAKADPELPVPSREDAEPEEEPLKPKKRRPNHRGRTKLSEDLERIITEVVVPDHERACTCCGAEMATFGTVDHERVEYVPAKLVVHVERREKLGCRACKGDAVTADRVEEPARPLRVGASFLVHLVESKCDDALPIHRQCDQFARLGFELPPSTAYGYWRYVTSLLEPIADALLGTILEDPVWVGIDDTGLDVLDRNRKGGKYRGHLWCFRASSGLVAYRFTETWEAREVAPWFHAIGKHTLTQVDDYKGYSSKVVGPDGVERFVVDPNRRLGCMMHVRRRFYQAFTLGDKRAAKPVAWIKELYAVEERAKDMSPDDRLSLRKEHSFPILDAFKAWMDETAPSLRKTGKLTEAVRYALQQWVYVRRCFEDGRLEIDNGACERAIREPAIGRKNFLFTGSADAAKRLAAAYSIVQTCRALGISTREYMLDVVTKLENGWPARRLTELLPQNWAAARA